ncbi:MAG: glycoside hydrolase family 1 protein [Candidatus Omnitrophica bacterium]|nr:glycoside hydrolase family 1 protein [Candidatus Omnitrophota bacterium]MBU1923356.1 glycoside hydrolase family 1 protein [Candidatus Omnitrophota bacterium]
MIKFSHDFLWGASTSAHQVEGGNIHNDWWQAEQGGVLKEASSQACRHYELYAEDFAIAKELGHNCHRFSIEWSRIEPQEGVFQDSEIEHYHKVIAELKSRGIEPVVTLHHFTNPVWFSQRGGWTKLKLQRYFLRFVEKMAKEFSSVVKFWVTINEPLVYSSHSYLLGVWPPGERSLFKTVKVTLNLAQAHIQAYRIIHKVYQDKKLERPMVSIAANLQAFELCRPTLKNKLAVYLRHKLYNLYFIEALLRKRTLDYIGINYYGRNLADVENWGIRHLLLDTCKYNHHPLRKNSLGWDIYPQGLYKLLILLKKYSLPILITENGVCTEDDDLKWDYIRGHLEQLNKSIEEGVNVFGYIYWSLIDNFEWDKGFGPRFGLVHIDYQNQKRTIRASARKLAEVSKSGLI